MFLDTGYAVEKLEPVKSLVEFDVPDYSLVNHKVLWRVFVHEMESFADLELTR
jgi:hypothetical protein